MTQSTHTWRRLGVFVLVAVLVVGTLPGAVSAQTETVGGVVVVEADETVRGNFNAVAGTVIVDGTIRGDLEATAGSVLITGRVTGDVETAAGSVTIEGTVDGDVEAAGGAFVLREGATVGGQLAAAAGDVRIDGAVGGDATLAGEEVTLGPAANVGGDLTYDAERFSRSPDATVAGTVTHDRSLEFGPGFPGEFAAPAGPVVPRGVGATYGLLVNLALGAVLLLVVPRFSAAVARTGTTEALRSGGVGLLTVVVVPIALVLVAITVIGIPLSIAGLLVFALALWIATVYGALVVGDWGLSLADRENRWGALVVGLVALAVLSFVPVVGGLLRAVIVLLGLGALVLALRDAYRGDDQESTGTAGGDDQPAEGSPTA